MSTSGITLYTAPTPNGLKIPIALEELGVPYEFRRLNLATAEQKEPWYLKINPNGRIPAIIDHNRGDFRVFESGAILLYLGEHYDPEGKIWPKTSDERSEVTQWLMFQMAGIGPMQGQATHFQKAAPEKIPYAINRYMDETKRLYKVIDDHLAEGREYIAAGRFTLADIAHYTWISGHDYSGISIDGFPNLKGWLERVGEREAVKKGLTIPPRA